MAEKSTWEQLRANLLIKALLENYIFLFIMFPLYIKKDKVPCQEQSKLWVVANGLTLLVSNP